MKKARKGPALLVIVILLILIAGYVCIAYQMVKPAKNVICNGVYVEDMDLSGMSREEAAGAVNDYIDAKLERLLEVDVNGEKVTAPLADIGFACEANDYIEQALKVGKERNPITNYATIKEVEKNHIVYRLSFTYSAKKLKSFIKKKCNRKCTKAKNATIKMEDGTLTYTEARDGVTIDADATVENIKKSLKEQEDKDRITASAEIQIQEPKITMEMASRCKDKIGSFRTTYNTGNVSRSKNLANAARLINGTVLYPGQTFSVHDTISPLTEDNGYYAAPSYNNGKVEDSIGGGVCQVSTTLYNAILFAELEIIERSPHSMVVSYVKPSMDAAIAGDYKDFKFRNNTEVPIYIEGGTYSGTIYFNVYGEENRSEDRKISFESETVETMQPGADKIIYDKTKPIGYSQVTQEAHTGYKAVLWKIVKENGKTKKTQVNSSTYQAVPRYVTKGTMETTPRTSVKPSQTAAPKKKEEKSEKKKKSQATKKPKSTAAPKTQEAPAPQTEEQDVAQ